MHLELWINAIFGCVRFGVWLIRFDGNLVMANWGWGVHASNFKGWFLYKKLSGSKVIDNKSSYRYNLFFFKLRLSWLKDKFFFHEIFQPFLKWGIQLQVQIYLLCNVDHHFLCTHTSSQYLYCIFCRKLETTYKTIWKFNILPGRIICSPVNISRFTRSPKITFLTFWNKIAAP